MRIVVTGFRGWSNRQQVLDDLTHWDKISGYRLQVAVGDCPTGADEFTREWITIHRREATSLVFLAGPDRFPGFRTIQVASWEVHNKAAGPRRNRVMVDKWEPFVVLAYLHPDSKGARGCAEYAGTKGIQVIPRWEGRES